MNQEVLTKFLSRTYCHQCGTVLKEAEAALLFESPVVSIAHIRCSKCGGETLAVLSVGGYSVTDIKTGLPPSEVKRFFNTPPISADDVLDLHELIRKGKIWQILRQKKGKSWGRKSKPSARRAMSRPFSLRKDKPPSPLS